MGITQCKQTRETRCRRKTKSDAKAKILLLLSQGITPQEVAGQFGLPVASVYTLRQRARGSKK